MAIIAQVNPIGTAGGTVTAASWGADYVTNNGAGTLLYDADAANGTTSVKVTQGTGALFGAFSTLLGGSKTDLWFSFELKLTAYATASNHFFRSQTGSPATTGWAIDISSTGATLVRDSANANVKQLTNAIPLNQWVRVEGHVVQAGASSTCQLLYYANVNSTSVTEDTGAFTGNFGTVTDQIQFGPQNATPQVPAFRFGHIAVGTAKIGAFGTAVVGPPTVNAGPDKTGSVGQPTVIGSSATATPAAGGTITGYQWVQVANGAPVVAITNPTSLTGATFTPAQPGAYEFDVTATQTG